MEAFAHKPLWQVIGVCGLLLALGCSPRLYAQSGGAETIVIPGGSSVRSSVTPKHSDKIVAHTGTESQVASAALVDRVAMHLGQPQDDLTFTVTNSTNNPINYEFNSGKQFDLVVSDSTGKTVWTLANHRNYSPLITHVTVMPGKSKSFEAVWNRRDSKDVPVPSGVYTVQARLTPIPRIVVSGTATADTAREGRDPTNVGTPSEPTRMAGSDDAQSGSVEQSDVTPSVAAKTNIVVAR